MRRWVGFEQQTPYDNQPPPKSNTNKTTPQTPQKKPKRTRRAVAEHGVDLGDELGLRAGVLRDAEERPRQHGGRRLVARNQHRHQVVAQLLVVGLLAAHVDEEAQQRGVAHLFYVGFGFVLFLSFCLF